MNNSCIDPRERERERQEKGERERERERGGGDVVGKSYIRTQSKHTVASTITII